MSIGTFLVSLVLLIIVLKIIALPFKIMIKFILNSILGGIILAICSIFGIGIAVYWWTILLTGLFGIPGFAIAAIITCLL